MSSEQPLVSVVTPVYNGGAYLAECVESIVHQTHSNFELTIVDNASTDETPDVASRYATQDSRIRHLRFDELVESNENHNRAFRAIHPESTYCKVVQADDWLYPECLERMVAVAQAGDDVALVSAFRIWGAKVDLDGIPPGRAVFPGREILRQALLQQIYVTGAPTAVLYRSSDVRARDPFYPMDFEHADTDAAYWLLGRGDFGFVHQVLSFARRQGGTRLSWASDMNTHGPENIRFLLRYGHLALDPQEYRRQLRVALRYFIRFHIRQTPKWSRLTDARFFDVHHAEIDAILAEGGADDREVRAALRLVRLLLARGRWHSQPEALIR
jgi:glycosyltransferase involved in cell wall biosynthesis